MPYLFYDIETERERRRRAIAPIPPESARDISFQVPNSRKFSGTFCLSMSESEFMQKWNFDIWKYVNMCAR